MNGREGKENVSEKGKAQGISWPRRELHEMYIIIVMLESLQVTATSGPVFHKDLTLQLSPDCSLRTITGKQKCSLLSSGLSALHGFDAGGSSGSRVTVGDHRASTFLCTPHHRPELGQGREEVKKRGHVHAPKDDEAGPT